MTGPGLQGFRLSPPQRRLWGLGTPEAYVAQAVAPLADPVDSARLRCAVLRMVERHEILRTVFRGVRGLALPLQMVEDEVRLDFAEAAGEVEEIARAERAPFDLEHGPMLRCRLVRSAWGPFLVITLPALCADRWTLSLVVRGVLQSRTEADPIPYVEICDWLDEQEESRASAWEEAAPAKLPLDAEPGDAAPFAVESQPVPADPALARTLCAAADRYGLPVEAFLFGCWQVLAARLNGGTAGAIGYVWHGREEEELAEVLGPVARTVAVSLPADPRATFLDAWRACAGRMARPHRGAVSGLRLQFEFGAHRPAWRMDCHGDRFALKLSCAAEGGEMGLRLDYDPAHFSPATVALLAERYPTLLAAFARDPLVNVLAPELVGPAERRLLLETWMPAAPAVADESIVPRFEQQTAVTPDHAAVVCEDRSLTYAELNAAANRVAHFLHAQGVGPEDRVAILLERSVEMIVALLGVLKSGAAYVGLDPKLPAERIAAILAEARTALVLREDLVPLSAGYSAANPAPAAAPANAAYVLYTSGSTGSPKGVVVEHRNLARYCRAIALRLDAAPGASYATVSTIAADLGHTAIFPALLSGGCLHVIGYERMFDGEALAEYAGCHAIDCLKLVPSHLRALLGASAADLLPRSRLVLGGEAWSWELAAQIHERAPGCALFNHYGPTETTVGVLAGRIGQAADHPGAARPPLGSPLAGARVYILDERLRPAPVGVAGEIWIGGGTVSRGYLNRPAATAERFVADPFAATPGARMYRSGDLGRWLPDGTVEFLGRADDQIKVRGHRVELAEIEAALRGCPEIGDAVVLAKPDPASGQRIVACMTARREFLDSSTAQLGTEQISDWLSVFDDTHSQLDAAGSRTFNPTGWNSTYTGGPMPEAEVREQVDATVARILALAPERVLEIGCGAGLLLFEIAPHCREYWGTDFCEPALAYVRRIAAGTDIEARLRLRQSDADRFDGLPESYFDAVVVNSTVQYFPDMAYLLRVIEGAVRVTRPGGAILLGDIRSLPLLEAFHASVQVARAATDAPADLIASLARQELEREDELVIDPAFFHALPGRLAGIGAVRVRLKRGLFSNELTKFRYDVVLRVAATEGAGSVLVLDWERDRLDGAAVRRLAEGSPAVVITGVPNARVMADVRAAAMLRDRRDPRGAGAPEGVDPEWFWGLGPDVDVTWSEGVDRFDVALGPGTAFPSRAVPVRHWSEYACLPLRDKFARHLIAAVRARLAEKLPDYMLPAEFVLVDELPLTANGKIDRAALLERTPVRPQSDQPLVAPRNPLETVVASVWAEVLRLDQVGVHHNFFEIGGHSLLATQVAARLRAIFDAGIPLRTFFEMPTVAGFCAAIAARQETPGRLQKVAEMLCRVEAESDPKLTG
jgi:amino acid adenylation domain-containing protein